MDMQLSLAERRKNQEREIVQMDTLKLIRNLAAAIEKSNMTTQELRDVQRQLQDIYLRF